mgnify:FL=1
MTFHISIEAETPVVFFDKMEEITNLVLNNKIEDHQLMDGSYQIGTSNIEIYEQDDIELELV